LNFIGIFLTLAAKKPMPYLIRTEETATCLECGKELYGRPEKKFCCESCKNKFHYRDIHKRNSVKNRVMANLNSNYRILEDLLQRSVSSISLADISQLGFNSKCATGIVISTRPRMPNKMFCFDITYKQSPSRLSEIKRLEHIFY